VADTAFAKIEDVVAAILGASTGTGAPLEGYVVLTDQPESQAIEAERAITLYTVSATPEQSDEQGQTYWRQVLQIEVIDGPQLAGSISRTVQTTLARVHALLAADRTLGGRLLDLQEIDLAGTQADGKDVHGASVQYGAEFFTPRDDWFTILGQAGAQF